MALRLLLMLAALIGLAACAAAPPTPDAALNLNAQRPTFFYFYSDN